MKSILVPILLLMPLLFSCVSQGTYDEAVYSRDSLIVVSDSLKKIIRSNEQSIVNLEILKGNALDEIENLKDKLINLQAQYEILKSESSDETQQLLTRIEELQNEIESRDRKLDDINSKLRARDDKINKLKEKLAQALLGFAESGLTVAIKNGKVYVSLSNQLLFSSGSTSIDEQGKKALLELAKVLEQNQDIEILVEGHTDDQAVRGGQRFGDNWDLSVLRATEVARFLELDGKVNPKRIIASGRSQYYPMADGSDKDARALNRRTEIILTPKLEQIFEIIE